MPKGYYASVVPLCGAVSHLPIFFLRFARYITVYYVTQNEGVKVDDVRADG